jgi:hypothetical protein
MAGGTGGLAPSGTFSMDDILRKIIEVQPVLHAAGTVSTEALSAIAKHASNRTITYSAETGCGATTLLFSHLSKNHTVFALDIGASVSSVRCSPLLQPGVVTFIEGPSQQTLPQFRFSNKLQLALIDGPHAYPFPDLEYYYLYPHLDTGALLILDDIQIRSIRNLFEFLCSDRMFQLEEVVRTTALFTRTNTPTFDPIGGGWQQQKYNARTLLRYDWRARLNRVFGRSLRRRFEALVSTTFAARHGRLIEICTPRRGERVGPSGAVEGKATLLGDCHVWVLVRRKDIDGWWPQGGGATRVSGDSWSAQVKYGDANDGGYEFEIAAAIVGRAIHERWMQWVQSVEATGEYPPVQLPKGEGLIAASYRTVTKV